MVFLGTSSLPERSVAGRADDSACEGDPSGPRSFEAVSRGLHVGGGWRCIDGQSSTQTWVLPSGHDAAVLLRFSALNPTITRVSQT